MSDLVDHADQCWPTPMTPDERSEWGKALADLDPDYVVATVGTLQRSYPDERPTTSRFLAAYRGVKGTAEKPERAPRRSGKQWADEIRAKTNIPTHLRSE